MAARAELESIHDHRTTNALNQTHSIHSTSASAKSICTPLPTAAPKQRHQPKYSGRVNINTADVCDTKHQHPHDNSCIFGTLKHHFTVVYCVTNGRNRRTGLYCLGSHHDLPHARLWGRRSESGREPPPGAPRHCRVHPAKVTLAAVGHHVRVVR